MQQRLPSLRVPPIGFAHRGARAHARENTIEAFTLARRLGATGLESDVWVTADGVAVLDHDGVVNASWGRKRSIGELRHEQLPRHIPTLGELVVECGTDYDLSLDLKDGDAGAVVIETLRNLAPAFLPRVWLCHPDWRALLPLRALDAEVRLVDSTRLARIKEGTERRAATLAEHGIDAVNLHHTDWNGGMVALFHRFGRYAFAWDLQFDRLLTTLLRMGIDGIYSDWVDRMVDALAVDASGG